MSQGKVERRLAAILAVDVAGYSRLMGLDEVGTHVRLKAHFDELFKPKIAEHRGRIVKTTGDGLLIEFPSVIEALQCALDIQTGMAERNADIPDDQRISFRVGINVGDIIIEADDIFGDGVNIAARLQEVAEAGGIAVSNSAYDHLAGKIEVTFDDTGVQQLKNIAQPIRVWRWPAVEKQPSTDEKPSRTEASDRYLHARQLYWALSKAENAQAQALLKRAIDLDPSFSSACACLAQSYLLDYLNQWSKKTDRPLELAYWLSERAVGLNQANAWAHAAIGDANLWKGRHHEALTSYRKAIILDPEFAEGHMGLSRALHYAGEPDEALQEIKKAMRLDPNFPGYYLHVLAQSQFQLGQYEECVASLMRRVTRDPKTDISRVLLAASYGHLQSVAEARWAWAEALRVNPKYSLEHRRQILPYKNPAHFEHICRGLRKADVPPLWYEPNAWVY